MMHQSVAHIELVSTLNDKFDVEIPQTVDEKDVLLLLEKRISILIEKNAEEFFQLMYRLDISEKRLADVMREQDAIAGIAKLVYSRQLEKIQSRMKYKALFDEGKEDEDLKW
jgi:beta-phosphoglucomutase-like phosphatase (HAD superfamily)